MGTSLTPGATLGRLRRAWSALSAEQWWLIAALGSATFFVGYDGSVLILALPAVARTFHASVGQLGVAISVLSLGALAAIPGAWLADRLGRRPVLLVSVVLYGLANAGSAMAPDLEVLTLMRLVAVFAASVEYGAAMVMLIEALPSDRRGLGVSVFTILAGFGSGLAAIIYPLAALNPQGWRIMYWSGLPVLLVALYLRSRIKESQLWTSARSSRRSPWSLLLAHPWRRRLLLISLAWLFVAVMVEPASLFLALFGARDLGLNVTSISAVIVVAGTVGSVGYPLGGWLGDRFGRRWPALIMIALESVSLALMYHAGVVGYSLGFGLASFFGSALTPVLASWTSELFPTAARVSANTIGGGTYILGRLLGLAIVGSLAARIGLGNVIAVLVIAPLLGCVLLGLLPETAGVELT